MKLDLATAERLVQLRQRKPFKSLRAAHSASVPTLEEAMQRSAVSSSFFEVRGRLRLGDRVLEQRR